MSIKETLIKVKKHPKNYKYYNGKFEEELGFYIVPITFLSKGSRVKVTRVCDNCGNELERPYKDILRYRKIDKDYCFRCGNNTSDALENKSNSHKGFVWAKESKIKASNTHKGMKQSENTKNKISKSVRNTMGSKEWKFWIKKYNKETYSLDAYINKYGEYEGERLYKLERKAKTPRCIEYWLIKHSGNADKAKQSLSNFQKRDLTFFIEKYGDINGRKKYDKYNILKVYNNSNKYSKSSQVFIKDIIDFCDLDTTSLYYGDEEWIVYLFKEERELFNNKKRILSLDFYDRKNNLVIEYDGNYWHSKDEQIFCDKMRDEVLNRRGLKTIRIKENDYLNNKNKVLMEVKNFYEDNKYKKQCRSSGT